MAFVVPFFVKDTCNNHQNNAIIKDLGRLGNHKPNWKEAIRNLFLDRFGHTNGGV